MLSRVFSEVSKDSGNESIKHRDATFTSLSSKANQITHKGSSRGGGEAKGKMRGLGRVESRVSPFWRDCQLSQV